LLIIYLTLLCSLLFTLGCKDYSEPESYKSPNAEFILDVMTQAHPSNDPDPYWQHLSLRTKEEKKVIFPANILKISAYDQPTVSWISSDTVKIEIAGTVGQSFDLKKVKSKMVKGVFCDISINQIQQNDP